MRRENVVRFPDKIGEHQKVDYAVMLSARGARVDFDILGSKPHGEIAEKARLAEMLRAVADRIDPP
jgi:hypothetical protein